MIQTEIEQNKSNLDYLVPAHMIRLVVKDLGRAFDAFFDKKRSDVHHPKFKDLMKIARKSPDFNPGMDRAFFYMCKFINSVVYFSIMNYNIST